MAPLTSAFVLAVAAGGGHGARVHHDAKLNLVGRLQERQKVQADAAVVSKEDACPAGIVKEETNGACVSESGQALPDSCCLVLRACRKDATDFLVYYQKWEGLYQATCGISSRDFDLTDDGLHLKFVGNNAMTVCRDTCQNDPTLKAKEPAPHKRGDLTEMCEGKVEENEWKPQLLSAIWPEDKVTGLDEQWETCAEEARPTPAPPPVGTITETTTRIFTDHNSPADFTFMTPDRTPQKGKRGIAHWFNKHILRRRQRNMQNFEEVVGLHTCKKRNAEGKAKRDQTYFASSLCYWLPDIDQLRQPSPVGIQWTGGPQGTTSMCNMLTGKGKCVKCSMCHNNAISPDGKVSYTAFPEEIQLPPGCLKESDIERNITTVFDTEKEPDLKAKMLDCTDKKNAYELAVQRFMKANATLTELIRQVDVEIPKLIELKQDEKKVHQQTLAASQKLEQEKRVEMALSEGDRGCGGYVMQTGFPFWWYQVTNEAFPTGELLSEIGILFCQRDSSYTYCRVCRTVVEALQRDYDVSKAAQDQLDIIEVQVKVLEASLAEKRAERAYWQASPPNPSRIDALETAKQTQEQIWLGPKEEECEGTPGGSEGVFKEYERKLNDEMKTEAPNFFDQSCEKSCTDIQRVYSEGCGVMEGSSPNDSRMHTNRGGIQNLCNPPQPSWVMSPWTYNSTGAIVEENGFDQCGRIFNSQRPKHAQKILKSGWMQKSGRYGGWWFGLRKYTWDNRYFALEQGDDVRSGVLRYWEMDPKKNLPGGNPERHNKFIILWDAKKVGDKDGKKYRRKGDSCFKLYHFYRDYRFCLKTAGERNAWRDLVKAEIKDLGRG